jgi:hypothetical protein
MTPKQRPVRLAGRAPTVGDLVRIGLSGVEIEGHITAVGAVLHVKVKATPLKVQPGKAKRTRSA